VALDGIPFESAGHYRVYTAQALFDAIASRRTPP
jgi:hypothetical protein